jgi:hypothetical protein
LQGVGIAAGSVSTFLGVLPLAFAASSTNRVFFKMMVGVILCGVLCGMILLPVLLSLFGPENGENATLQRDDGSAAIQEAGATPHRGNNSTADMRGGSQDDIVVPFAGTPEAPADASAGTGADSMLGSVLGQRATSIARLNIARNLSQVWKRQETMNGRTVDEAVTEMATIAESQNKESSKVVHADTSPKTCIYK